MLDVLLPAAHRERPDYLDPRAEFIERDVRDDDAVARAVDGVSAVCHQAAMVGLGVDLDDITEYAGINDLGTAVLLRALARRPVPLVLASSMVVYGEGRYRCAEHGVVRPGPRSADALDAGQFEPPCPACGRALGRRGGPGGRAAGPAQRLRGDEGRAGAPVRRLRARDGRAGDRAALPQRLRPADAARHALRGRRVDLPLGAGGRPGAAGVRGRQPDARLRARPRRRPRERHRACVRAPRERSTSPPARRAAWGRWRGRSRRARSRSRASGGRATCGTCSRRRRALPPSSASAPSRTSPAGMREFRAGEAALLTLSR